MTTEEKAKAYDEALEKAKSMIDDLRKGEDILAVSDLESMFPELKESEDEKMLRTIIRGFENWKSNGREIFNNTKVDDILAYLEKQKINTEGDFGRGYDCGYKACLNSHGAEFFEKQKEQKPLEWSEEDEKHINLILRVLNAQQCWDGATGKKFNPYQREIDWLKSLRPSWKPSKEQMTALLRAEGVVRVHDTKELAAAIAQLYEQLKKLGVKEEPEYYQHFDPDC